MKRVAIASLFLLAGCEGVFQSEEEQAKQAVQEQVAQVLKDPSSAQFQNVQALDEEAFWYICGEVNGKNSFGAYAGFDRFYGTYYPMTDMATGAIVENDDYSIYSNRCDVTGAPISIEEQKALAEKEEEGA